MMQEFYTPNGYQTVESPEYKPFTFVFVVNKGGQWTPQSFTATAEYSDSYDAWEHRNYNKLEEGAEWAIYPVMRYETPNMIIAELATAVARLSELDDHESRRLTAHIRNLTSKYDRAIYKEEFNRNAEAANVTA